MKPIVLDYKQDPELFNETAKEWAENVCSKRGNDCGVKSSQLRNFYDKVLELYDKTEKDSVPWEDVLPFVKMLNSKVAYAKTRKTVNDEFVSMMTQCIKQVDTSEKLRMFKLFFEAVIGFYPKK